jgi:hypothetical protein
MKSLLTRDQATLVGAFSQQVTIERFRRTPGAALSALNVQMANKADAQDEATRFFGQAVDDRDYLNQLLVTACDSDFEATETIETNASDRNC